MGSIRSSLLKDFVSLSKIESLPWDHWCGLLSKKDLSQENMSYVDSIAALTLGGNDAFAELRRTYEDDIRLHGPVMSRQKAREGDRWPTLMGSVRVDVDQTSWGSQLRMTYRP